MREDTQTLVQCLGVPVGRLALALAGVFGDGAGDGIVQAAVQGPEFIDTDLRAGFEGQVGDGLAQVTVVMHHFLNR
ncbi:hypothetical protein D9M68_810950 [compost metagenome]